MYKISSIESTICSFEGIFQDLIADSAVLEKATAGNQAVEAGPSGAKVVEFPTDDHSLKESNDALSAETPNGEEGLKQTNILSSSTSPTSTAESSISLTPTLFDAELKRLAYQPEAAIVKATELTKTTSSGLTLIRSPWPTDPTPNCKTPLMKSKWMQWSS